MPDAHYRPIADYAVVGCTRSAALISSEGSIDWLCWPRFDSPSVFARLLDDQRGGYFSIRPRVEFKSQRRYLDGTNVLETIFKTADGIVRLIDLMPVMREEEKRQHLSPFRQMLRRVEGVSGEVPIEVHFCPRPNYARRPQDLKYRRDSVFCEQTPTTLHMRSDVKFDLDGPDATARFTMRKGDRHDFALAFEDRSPAVMPHIGDDATLTIERTVKFWREWSSQCTYTGPYRDRVLRSALVLKLLAYAPSGAIVAAATTSLPEKVGGVRNWDYRYCWLRDASFTVAAFDHIGFTVEGSAFVDWILYATRLTHPRLQILYDVFGEPKMPERVLSHLEGYRRSAPVRIGNDAHRQIQLDIYGEVLGAVEEQLEPNSEDAPRPELYRDVQQLLCRLADRVVDHWKEPDSGVWEKRGAPQQHVHAKVMSWAALDCAERLARKKYIPDRRVDVWRQTKAEIRNTVLERGFNREMGSFVSILDGDELDASLLAAARVGFLEPDDPRILGTIDAIRKRLGRQELLYRYEFQTDDGLPPGEGAFLACSFWLVEALAYAGRIDEARATFEKLLHRCNDVGLYSEEIDVESGALLGNFPQALTHIGLINAALRLT
ncbi:MAG TPA: glycoside hydrolase family 15 protein [Thermoanaerobaculia bacterium]|nr:glycoside hydrolase family 15 protein [Thermoanaerobaculia bacterium]